MQTGGTHNRERAILAGLHFKSRRPAADPDESLEELAELAISAGAVVLDRIVQTRDAPQAATLIGAGKVEEIRVAIASHNADLVIFDHDLTPTQQRNLEKGLDVKVLDRTQLILDIFASRARTREGRLQVELAQLNYILPRLTGKGIEMSRLGGGIGTRGPGETQLETDRRRIARRIKKIDQDIEKVRSSRALHRRKRSAVPLPLIAVAGYTNAGKSTLFNSLTLSGVLSDARMFATLDPTVRVLKLPSKRRVLAGDTVGFIRNLPTTLVKAFRATLEEITAAALILHVVDASSPHAGAQTRHVLQVLSEIGAAENPQLLVLNKIDRVSDASTSFESIRRGIGNVRSVEISALTGQGIGELLAAIDEVLAFDPVSRRRFRLAAGDGARIHMLHEFGRVLHSDYHDGVCEIEAEVPQSLGSLLADAALK